MEKKQIRCRFSEGMIGLRPYVEKYYDVIETSDNPEFAFLASCDTEAYPYLFDCVRIQEIGENIRPNFNSFDFAYGFDRDLHFGDRYLYLPLYAVPDYQKDMKKALEKHLRSDEDFLRRENFCAMVVSNIDFGADERVNFFNLLSGYKRVDSGGRGMNNLPDGKPVEDKAAFLENYKFSMAFENSRYPGYTTEKIVQAWASGTIPIYWGDPTIAEQFNEKAFINCNRYGSFEEVIAEIRRLDEDEAAYLAMQHEPIMLPQMAETCSNPEEEQCTEQIRQVASGQASHVATLETLISEEYVASWIRGIIDQGPEKALRRTNSKVGWGSHADNNERMLNEMRDSKITNFVFRVTKIIKYKLGND